MHPLLSCLLIVLNSPLDGYGVLGATVIIVVTKCLASLASCPSSRWMCDGVGVCGKRWLGFVTGIPWVGYFHTIPVPIVTVPVTGAGTHRTHSAAV